MRFLYNALIGGANQLTERVFGVRLDSWKETVVLRWVKVILYGTGERLTPEVLTVAYNSKARKESEKPTPQKSVPAAQKEEATGQTTCEIPLEETAAINLRTPDCSERSKTLTCLQSSADTLTSTPSSEPSSSSKSQTSCAITANSCKVVFGHDEERPITTVSHNNENKQQVRLEASAGASTSNGKAPEKDNSASDSRKSVALILPPLDLSKIAKFRGCQINSPHTSRDSSSVNAASVNKAAAEAKPKTKRSFCQRLKKKVKKGFSAASTCFNIICLAPRAEGFSEIYKSDDFLTRGDLIEAERLSKGDPAAKRRLLQQLRHARAISNAARRRRAEASRSSQH